MTATYRIQFLASSTSHGATVLVETTVAGSVDAAIRHAAEAEWPPGATALRLGRVFRLREERKGIIGGGTFGVLARRGIPKSANV